VSPGVGVRYLESPQEIYEKSHTFYKKSHVFILPHHHSETPGGRGRNLSKEPCILSKKERAMHSMNKKEPCFP